MATAARRWRCLVVSLCRGGQADVPRALGRKGFEGGACVAVAYDVASPILHRRVEVLQDLVGGLVGAGTDAYYTWQIGRYADRELLPRTRR